jgi:hypothetical protein
MQILQEQCVCPCGRPFGRNDIKDQQVKKVTLNGEKTI